MPKRLIAMKTFSVTLLLATLASLSLGQNLYFPPLVGDTWDTLAPDSLNWCPDKIDSLYQFLEDEQTDAFMILKDGKIVLERYFGNYTADSSHVWFSAGKSLIATLVGIAQQNGDLSITDKTSEHLGVGWTNMPQTQEDSITVWHQLSMTTGLDETDFECTDDTCLNYAAPAGSRWFYHNAPYSLLRDVLESATGTNINVYCNTEVFSKTGMTGLWLPFGYNNFFFSKARSMARFGLLIQNKGTWDGTPVLSDTTYWNEMVNTSQTLNPAYGFLWWLNGKSSYIPPGTSFSFPGAMTPAAPSDMYCAAGAQGQLICVVPSQGLVMVRQGSSNSSDLTAISLLNNIWTEIAKLECDPTSVAEVENADRFSVYPNPASGTVRLTHLPVGCEHLRIYDQQGRLVQVASPALELDLSGLPSGFYLLEATGNGATVHRRLIKN